VAVVAALSFVVGAGVMFMGFAHTLKPVILICEQEWERRKTPPKPPDYDSEL
jgi:hypothetical protein